VSDLVHDTSHADEGLARSLERFKGQPNWELLLKLFLFRVQGMEDVAWELYQGMFLDVAQGPQLDMLGDTVGEPRNGRQDDQYRLFIRARVKINRANGKVSDVLEVAKLVLEPTATVTYTPEYPAAYKVTVTGSSISARDIRDILVQVKPAGVGMSVVRTEDLATALIFDTLTPLTNGLDHGLLGDDV